MYACGEIFYGVPLNHLDYSARRDGPRKSKELERIIETNEGGFHTRYSGSSDVTPSAFGVDLASFDTCEHHDELAQTSFVPFPAQLAEFDALWGAVDPAIQAEIVASFGKPRVFILWSTS